MQFLQTAVEKYAPYVALGALAFRNVGVVVRVVLLLILVAIVCEILRHELTDEELVHAREGTKACLRACWRVGHRAVSTAYSVLTNATMSAPSDSSEL